MMQIPELYKIFIQNPIISIDTRSINKGDIFWALKGDNFDGNNFIEPALNSGASYVITDKLQYINKKNCFYFKNSLKTLQDLALYHRKQLNIPIIGITGTNGKTTTKELTSQVLSTQFKIKSTKGNLNNHIGVPLTLLSINQNTEIGVVEMGANHPKEIKDLCDIALPNFGIITNIGKAHLEGFGSFEGLIKTKAELYQAIESNNGSIFLNIDNPLLKKLIKKQKIITYGTENKSFLSGKLISSDPFLKLLIQDESEFIINSKLIGRYNFENILAAACIGKYFNISNENIKLAIENYIPENNRSQIINKESINIISDAYNANPTSMSTAIDSFMSLNYKNKVLILGDMFELGKFADEEHIKIIKKLIEIQQNDNSIRILLTGHLFNSFTKKQFPDSDILSFNTTYNLIDYIKQNTFKDAWILIKGSRGMKLESVIEYIN